MLMILVNISNILMYCPSNIGNKIVIQKTFSLHRFEKMLRFINFNNKNNISPKIIQAMTDYIK